jgi:hypothetical protein
MNRHRNFPEGTCPASRHAAIIAEALCRGKPYPMLAEEPVHCGETIAAVVASLWQARAQLHRLGYECEPDSRGRLRWVPRWPRPSMKPTNVTRIKRKGD